MLEFNFEIGGFAEAYGVETDVLEGGAASGIGDSTIYRIDGQDISDAPPQPAMKVKRGECASGFGEMRRVGSTGISRFSSAWEYGPCASRSSWVRSCENSARRSRATPLWD